LLDALTERGLTLLKVLLFGFILGCVAPASAGATAWYVAQTGSDSYSCTQAQNPSTPKATIRGGLACVGTAAGAGAGHTVQVANGTYAETISTWPSGAQGNPFTLKSATLRGAIIRPGSGSNQILFLNSNYVTVDGFVIDGTNVSANNVWINPTTGVTIQNSEIKNTKASTLCCENSFQALYATGAVNATIRNNLIHDIAIGAPHFHSHGIYWGGWNSLIEGNTIYSISGCGMQIYSGNVRTLDNNTVRGNRIYDFAKGGSCTGIYISNGTNNVAYNNIIYQTVFNASAYGISLKNNGNKAYNNTVYNTAVGIEVAGTGSVAQNNLLSKTGLSLLGSGYTVDHNLVSADPKFVNLSTFDFRLQSTSPAIDAGVAITEVSTDVDGMTRPYGNGFDLGAFEYGVATAPAPPTNIHVIR
jgi:Right handed beta helix region